MVIPWFRRCRCTRCNDLARQLRDAEGDLEAEKGLSSALARERDLARKEADNNHDAWQKASDERDDLQRLLNEIVEIAQGTEP